MNTDPRPGSAMQNRIALGSERRRILGSTEPGVTSWRNCGHRASCQDRLVAGPAVVRPVRGNLTDVAFDPVEHQRQVWTVVHGAGGQVRGNDFLGRIWRQLL